MDYIPFTVWSIEDIVENINSNAIESHLSEVYQAIGSNSANEKMHTLTYFETMIVNSNVANRLINSAFVNLFIRILKMVKSPSLKNRICSIIGLLVRHATIIENDRAEIGITEGLEGVLDDKNNQVRRRAMAALGEFLFYAATQLDDEQSDPVWEISHDTIMRVSRMTRKGEDTVTRFYACKTIENITAQSREAGERFSNGDTAKYLLDAYMTATEKESFRVSAGVALSHMSKLNKNLFPLIFDTITADGFFKNLNDGNVRI